MSLNFDQFDDYEFDEHPFVRVDPDNGLYVGDRLLRHATVTRESYPVDWVSDLWDDHDRPNASLRTLTERAYVPLENGRHAELRWSRWHRDNYGDFDQPGLDFAKSDRDNAHVSSARITARATIPGVAEDSHGFDGDDEEATYAERKAIYIQQRKTPEAVMDGIAAVGSMRPPESVRRGERPEVYDLRVLRDTYRRQAEGKPDARYEDIVYDPMNRNRR